MSDPDQNSDGTPRRPESAAGAELRGGANPANDAPFGGTTDGLTGSPAAETPAETLPAATVPFAAYPEDLRAPWGWLDIVIFVLLAVCGQLVLDTVMLGAAVSLGYTKADPVAIQKFATTSAGFVTLRQVILWSVMMGYLYYALRGRSAEGFWRMLGWRRLRIEGVPPRTVYWAFALSGVPLAYVVSLLSGLAQPKDRLPIEAFFQDPRSVILLSAMGILVAPLAEEMVFRGFLYPVLARSLGVAGGVIVTGVLFGLLHAQQLEGGRAQIFLLVLVGVLFTAVRARMKSVTACYLLHLGYNSFLFLGFFLATDFLRKIPPR